MNWRLAFLVSTLILWSAPARGQTLRIYDIDVDQGGATLFVSPAGHTLLVDAGKDGHGARIRAIMQQAGVTRIDHFVATHYHEDHYGGVDELRSPPAITIAHAYDRGDKNFLPASRTNSPTYIAYQNTVGQAATALTRGATIALDPAMTVRCISAGGAVLGEINPPAPGNDENDMSVSLLVTFGNFRYFVGGDIETATELKIAQRDLVMDVDVYHADHHGAENGSSADFLADMKPTVVVISNGSTLSYRHPRQVTLNRIRALTPQPTIFQTNKYMAGGTDGGNVADQFIADLETTDADGTILTTVNAGTGTFTVTYRNQSHTFTTKRAATGSVVIESLMPNPVGDDVQLEDVIVRNKGTAAVSLSGWVLEDASGKAWAMSGSLGAGQRVTIRRNGMPMNLNNTNEDVRLLDGTGAERDRFHYATSQEGVRLTTGH